MYTPNLQYNMTVNFETRVFRVTIYKIHSHLLRMLPSQGRNLVREGGGVISSPRTRFTPPLRTQFAHPLLKLSFSQNLIKSKISLHNSSIHRNRSVFFVISLPLLYYMAHFLFFRIFFTRLVKIGSNFATFPPGFR